MLFSLSVPSLLSPTALIGQLIMSSDGIVLRSDKSFLIMSAAMQAGSHIDLMCEIKFIRACYSTISIVKCEFKAI